MNAWTLATLLLVPPFALVAVAALRGSVTSRLAAVQMAGSLAALVLALMTFATDQASFIDLAFCLTLLSVPGALLTAVFVERWL